VLGWTRLSVGLTPPPGASLHVLADPQLTRAISACFPVAALHVLGLHVTPVLFGRTEPPGRLPSCARFPLEAVGLLRLSPLLRGFRTRHLSPHGSQPSSGPLYENLAVVAPRRTQVCTLPLLVRCRAEPPGRLHPSTRNLIASSRIPRRLEPFPTIVVPVSRPFPLRFPDSREPVYTRLAGAVPRLAKVCKLPLLISAEQSPLAAIPSSTRFPATVSRAVRCTFQVDNGLFILTALGPALGLISVLTQPRHCGVLWSARYPYQHSPGSATGF